MARHRAARQYLMGLARSRYARNDARVTVRA